jgi:hypothetical protein
MTKEEIEHNSRHLFIYDHLKSYEKFDFYDDHQAWSTLNHFK